MPPIEINGETVNDVQVNGQSVDEVTANGQTVFTAIPDSETIQRPSDTGDTNKTVRTGFWITPNYELSQIDVVISGSSAPSGEEIDEVAIYDSSDNLVANTTGMFASGETVSLSGLSLQADSDYGVVADGDYQAGAYNDDTQWPYEVELASITEGFDGDVTGNTTNTNFWCFNEVTVYS